MEKILSQFNTSDLDIKLTNDKLFINTAISNETFALRSVNGIGVVDLVEDYNKALTEWKKSHFGTIFSSYALMGFGPLIIIAGLMSDESQILIGIILGLSMSIGGYFMLKNKKMEPNLMSAVRIMMSGGNRDFQFDKTSVSSDKIAEFVSEVESTLTAYHKNNL